MCGIACCTGFPDAGDVLLGELKLLEYRGYDSAGMTLGGSPLHTLKVSGKVAELEELFRKEKHSGTWGIAHTRWATHGPPTPENAHPHLSDSGGISVVHNGIIENHEALKSKLRAEGHVFRSETDSEVIPHLIETFHSGDPLEDTASALRLCSGSCACAVMFENFPGTIVAACKGSPLVLGVSEQGVLAASDASALAPYARETVPLRDGEIAVLTPRGFRICRIADLSPVHREARKLSGRNADTGKGAFEHYMLKEIMEQPEILRNSLAARIDIEQGAVLFPEIGIPRRELARISRIVIAGCGSSLHAGLTGEYYFEDLAGIPTAAVQAAEFRYRNPVLDPDTLVIAVSQSGETADTLAAVREAKEKGCPVIALCNAEGSAIAREADSSLCLNAGIERSVAATKTFTAQMTHLFLLALFLGRARHLAKDDTAVRLREVSRLPELLLRTLAQRERIRTLAEKYLDAKNFFYIGRDCLYPAALEGALKLKEISYVHAEGYHAAELKHGPLALLDETLPVMALANRSLGQEKTVGNIRECMSRHAPVIAVATENDGLCGLRDVERLDVPDSPRHLTPVVTAAALQLFAYFFARAKGCPVDLPRNLAKSVTVE